MTRTNNSAPDHECDALIVGGGMVGLVAAWAFCEAGRDVVLCAPDHASRDPRTTAVLDDSLRYLDRLGLWEALSQTAHPLRIMRLVDATSRLLRFPQTDFDAAETGLEAFGYTIQNQILMDELTRRLDNSDRVTRINGTLHAIETNDARSTAKIETEKGERSVETALIVGADGRNSFVRKHFGHGERMWRYPQSAIVLDFEHQFPSQQTSTEFHTETGPFTIVPQSANKAGLVWLETPERAEEIVAMEVAALNGLLENRMHSSLGRINVTNRPKTFPMTGMVAKCFGDQHHALIGEAAHVFPPIGAQGFNLGIRDISALVDASIRFSSTESPGKKYDRQRRLDINSRTYGVDMLNRTLLSDLLPAQLAKSFGMFALRNLKPLRQKVMKTGMGSGLTASWQ